MKKGTISGDGKRRADITISFRIGTQEITAAIIYAAEHFGYKDNYHGWQLGKLDLDRRILCIAHNFTKPQIEEVVKEVLHEAGSMFEQRIWDINYDTSVGEEVQRLIADRYALEFNEAERRA